MSPLKRGRGSKNSGKVEDGDNRITGRGRKKLKVPEDLIKELASKGYGVKSIARQLYEQQGIVISYRTIQRRLQNSLL
jgi:hypothetical protein